MKLLINTTTILSLALYVVPPFAAQAQDLQTVKVGEQAVICLPNKETACPDGAFCVVAKNPDNCQANAEKAVASAAEKAAADQAAADQATADKAIADQAATDQAATDKAAADKAAADQAAVDQAAADKAAADQAAADQAAADKAAADQAAADKAAADQAAADKAAADQAAADKAAADQPATQQTTAVQADTSPVLKPFKTVTTASGREVICLPDKAAVCPEGQLCVVAAKTAKCEALAEKKVAALDAAATKKTADEKKAEDAGAAAQIAGNKAAADKAAADQAAMDEANIAAAKKAEAEAAAKAAADPNLKPVEAPVVNEQATQTLETVLAAPADTSDPTVAPAAPVAAAAGESTDLTAPLKDQPVVPASKDVTVTTETVTEADTRASSQDFAAAPVEVAPGKKSGLSDLEKVGLLALGALVIGTMINNNKQQVVSNTGDRVVVKQEDGTYQVYKDDNSLLREPGSKVTTQTYQDGSTRSIVTRQDGSQISTVRDASGRVLQRVAYDSNGRGTVLIDDLQPEHKIDVSTLPKPRADRNTITVDGGDAAMRAALASADAADLGQKFSLRQIRTVKEVRWLAPTIDVNNITFETGSAAIQPTEARKLAKLGRFITDMVDENPGEVFLIEGHTDAVGSAASNLALSDRRAESVAKALTEYFHVPPENMVVQGYGETELAVDSGGDERANRRVAVRIITPLLKQAAN